MVPDGSSSKGRNAAVAPEAAISESRIFDGRVFTTETRATVRPRHTGTVAPSALAMKVCPAIASGVRGMTPSASVCVALRRKSSICVAGRSSVASAEVTVAGSAMLPDALATTNTSFWPAVASVSSCTPMR